MTWTNQTYGIIGLTGGLAVYNGHAARCYHGGTVNGEPSATWHFPVSSKLTLELPRRFLHELSACDYPTAEASAWQMIMQDYLADNTQGKATSNNRQDVRATADSLIMQLRRVLTKRAGSDIAEKAIWAQPMKDLFHEMDSNHNGQLDKKEFLDGCLNVGISISPPEINLVWPLFDTNGNGLIDTDELSSFLEARRTGRKTSVEMHAVSKQLRQHRIVNKSAYATRLKVIAESLRESIFDIIAKEKITQEELFVRLDFDGGGSLDRSEILGGLRRTGIPLSLTDMNLLWPMFSLDSDGAVGKHEWEIFLDPKGLESWWSYSMTSDLFTTNVQLAPSELSEGHSNQTDEATALQQQPPRDGSSAARLSTPKRRRRKPRTTAAERAVLYNSPGVQRLRGCVPFAELQGEEEAGVHAPTPPRARRAVGGAAGGWGRRHSGQTKESVAGQGGKMTSAMTLREQASCNAHQLFEQVEQASCDGEGASQLRLPARMPAAMKPSPPLTRAPRNARRRCVNLPHSAPFALALADTICPFVVLQAIASSHRRRRRQRARTARQQPAAQVGVGRLQHRRRRQQGTGQGRAVPPRRSGRDRAAPCAPLN
jgi:Ca2+-binding EF-hand superfamily protein